VFFALAQNGGNQCAASEWRALHSLSLKAASDNLKLIQKAGLFEVVSANDNHAILMYIKFFRKLDC
jgi:hypothetical protein